MEIRFAQAGDVSGIMRLLRQVGQVHHQGRPDLFRANAQKYGASQILARLGDEDAPIFVAVADGAVAGYCFCAVQKHENDPVLMDRTALYIDDLCVSENCRRQGVGSALLAQARSYAAQRGCYHLTLNVWQCNEAAMAFYRRCGMAPLKTTLETILEDA